MERRGDGVDPEAIAAVAAEVERLLPAVIEDSLIFARRKKILDGLLADCAEIRAALAAEDDRAQPA